VDVDDLVACTADSCDPAAGVQHDPDHLACAAGQHCDPGAGCASAGVVEDCIVSFPIFFPAVSGEPTPLVYGRVYSTGVTEPDGPSDRVVADVGYGTQGTDPAVGWTWFAASYRIQRPIHDEYQGTMLAPAPGTYDYAYRMSVDAGRTFTYCDTAGIYDPGSPTFGVMTVTP